MVLISRLICPVCKEAYNSDDIVYTTSCGHVYHLSCMREWLLRSKNCPQCRNHNPKCFRLYLELDRDEDLAAKNIKLLAKLEENIHVAASMENQLKATRSNLVQFQEKLVVCEREFSVRMDDKETRHVALLEEKNSKISELERELKSAKDAFLAQQPPKIAGNINTNGEFFDWEKEKRSMEREIRKLNSLLQKALSQQADSCIEMAKEMQISAKLSNDKMKLEHELERAKQQIGTLTKGNLKVFQVKGDLKSMEAGHQANLASANVSTSIGNPPVAFHLAYKLPVGQALQSSNNHVEVNGNSNQYGCSKIYALYSVAKVLRSYGYKFMYVYKNQVFARVDKQSKAIVIRDKEQVDAMVKFHEENPNTTLDQYLHFVDGLSKSAKKN